MAVGSGEQAFLAEADLRISRGRRTRRGTSRFLPPPRRISLVLAAFACGTQATRMLEQTERRHRAPRPGLGHRVPRGGRIRSSSKLTVSMSLRYLGTGLRAQVQQLVTAPAPLRRVPARRGGGLRRRHFRFAKKLRARGRAPGVRLPGARLEGGLEKGECPRAAATATSPCRCRRARRISPRHPAAPRALTPRSRVCES